MPTEQTVRFASGVYIDWTRGAVELDAKVVFRRGPLELIACSPQTREHESILVTKARPARVFQAMGLVGLTPGSPVQYDERSKKWLPPTGERLRVLVRCTGDPRFRPVREWVRDPKTKENPTEIPWVFAGSKTLPDGRFLADLDGTIVCLVDFESALVTVGALHTAENTSLWLEADTASIPAIATKCTLRIEGTTARIVVTLRKDGRLVVEDREVSPEAVSKLPAVMGDQKSIIVLLCDQMVSDDQIQKVRSKILGGGVQAERLSIRRPPQPLSRP